jgi:hypothetical protein
MAMDIGEVHSVSVGDRHGYAFNLKDSAGRRWMTLAYETEAEAKAAWEKIISAAAGVISAAISP